MKRYATCESGVEVAKEQDKIMEELENDYNEARVKGNLILARGVSFLIRCSG